MTSKKSMITMADHSAPEVKKLRARVGDGGLQQAGRV